MENSEDSIQSGQELRTSRKVQLILLLSMNGESLAKLKERFEGDAPGIVEVRTYETAQKELLEKPYAALVDRCSRIGSKEYEILEFIRSHRLPTRVIVLPKAGSVEDAVSVVKAGASDVILARELDTTAAESVLKSVTKGESPNPQAGEAGGTKSTSPETMLVGQSLAIQEIRSAIDLVARSQTAVLITGESGTGKDIVARLVHLQSDRSDKPFIAMNCAALPKDVIENELFGHERGAFTGALQKKAGCFELADSGTLFFDEIAEMSSDTQAKLLRAIEAKAFRRLGGKEEIHVNVRMIAATNKKMSEALKSGEFREDLYYRFSVIEISISPLRERREDVPVLVNHFLSILGKQYGKPQLRFSDECLAILKAYDWPGNVRELRNVIERVVVTCRNELIEPRCLPERLSVLRNVGTTITLPIGISAWEAERRFIIQTLAAVGENKTKASQVLGVSRKTLHNKLREYSR